MQAIAGFVAAVVAFFQSMEALSKMKAFLKSPFGVVSVVVVVVSLVAFGKPMVKAALSFGGASKPEPLTAQRFDDFYKEYRAQKAFNEQARQFDVIFMKNMMARAEQLQKEVQGCQAQAAAIRGEVRAAAKRLSSKGLF